MISRISNFRTSGSSSSRSSGYGGKLPSTSQKDSKYAEFCYNLLLVFIRCIWINSINFSAEPVKTMQQSRIKPIQPFHQASVDRWAGKKSIPIFLLKRKRIIINSPFLSKKNPKVHNVVGAAVIHLVAVAIVANKIHLHHRLKQAKPGKPKTIILVLKSI